jgi:hypothetical protein
VSYEDAPAAIAAVWEVAKDWPGWGAWDGETPESVGPALISEIRSALYYLLHHRAHRYNNNNNEVCVYFLSGLSGRATARGGASGALLLPLLRLLPTTGWVRWPC